MRRASSAGERPGRGLFLAASLAALLCATTAPTALAQDAYVADYGSNSVSVIDLQTDAVIGAPIPVGTNPEAIAITPDGRRAYVADEGSEEVSVIDTETNQAVGSIKVGDGPDAIAITPDGRRAYVTDLRSEDVSVIDTETDQLVGSPIALGSEPFGVAISPDGRRAYVADLRSGSVSVIDTETDQLEGEPIAVGKEPVGVAISPDGRRVYVPDASPESDSVSVIDTETDQVIATPSVGGEPWAVAISPDGKVAYVTNEETDDVSVIDTETNEVIGSPIAVGAYPYDAAISPDGRRAYITNLASDDVSVIDTATDQVIGSPIGVGKSPAGIAIPPAQPPLASFSVPAAKAGVPVAFDASASSYPQGSTPSYEWEFGDGTKAEDGGPDPSHTYSAPGVYEAKLTLSDDVCPAELIFTGQTAYCDGPVVGSETRSVRVAAGPATSVAVSLTPSSILASGTSTSTATAIVTDPNGNPVTDQDVTFSSTDAGEGIGPVSEPSEGAYVATITSSTTAGTPTITATDDSVIPSVSGDKTLTQNAGPATSVAVSLTPSSILASGTSTSTATAIVTDPNGNPVTDQDVTFSSTDAGEGIGPVSEPSEGAYVATITSSSIEGLSTITGTDNSTSPPILGRAELIQDLYRPFIFGRVKHIVSKGTAKLEVISPGPGELSLTGTHILDQDTPALSGPVRISIAAKGKTLRLLRRTGRALVTVTVTFRPTFGTPSSKKKKVELVDRTRRR